MARLHPTFSLAVGRLRATTANPVGGPTAFRVERSMDVPADALRVRLATRSGIALDDEVELRLGYDGEEETVFSGRVAALRPAIAGVEVQALGRMEALLRLRTAATFDGQSAGDIARHLIGEAGAEAGTVDDGPTLPHYALDERLSAYAHLKQLADRLGYELYTDRAGTVCFHGLGPGAGLETGLGAVSAVSALLGGGEGYRFGQHLLEARALRRPRAWGSVAVGGESPMSGQGETTAHWLTINDADYRGAAGSGEPRRLVIEPLARTKDLADRFAAGWLAVASRREHAVRIGVFGRASLDLGQTITVSDLPDELAGGTGYVRALRHRFDAQAGFVTEVSISVAAG